MAGLLTAIGMGAAVIGGLTAYFLCAAWLAKKLGHDPASVPVAFLIVGFPSLAILALIH